MPLALPIGAAHGITTLQPASTGRIAPQRYRDDLGAGGADRPLHDRRRRIQRAADKQARGEGFAVEVQHGVNIPNTSRRPGERRDPYAVSSPWGTVGRCLL